MRNQNILVPVDFSVISLKGLKAAVALAKRQCIHVHLVHVMKEGAFGLRTDGYLVSSDYEKDEYDKQIREIYLHRAKQLRLLANGCKEPKARVSTEIMHGAFEDAIANYVRCHAIDVVIMGTTAQETIADVLRGSYASKLMRSLSIPVLTIKNEDSFDLEANKLLLLIDYADYEPEAVLQIRDFAESFSLKVLLVNISRYDHLALDVQQYYLGKFAADFGFANYETHLFPQSYDPDEITAFANEMHAGMVAIIASNACDTFEMIFGNDIEKYMQQVRKPMLMISA